MSNKYNITLTEVEMRYLIALLNGTVEIRAGALDDSRLTGIGALDLTDKIKKVYNEKQPSQPRSP